MYNKLTSFPNYTPLGRSLKLMKIDGNKIAGMITSDMVKDLSNLNYHQIRNNKLQRFRCHLLSWHHPIKINVHQITDLEIFENPYRFCIHLLDTFATKTKMVLTSTKIPCDHHRCWMKKYASKFIIQIDNCPDGRIWSTVTEEDLCSRG